MERQKDSEPRSIEIRFGMIYAHWYKKKCSLYVVVDVGKDDWFATSGIFVNKGKIALGIAGTGVPDYVDLVLGQWGEDQILEAYKNLFEGEVPKLTAEAITKNAAASPRTIYF